MHMLQTIAPSGRMLLLPVLMLFCWLAGPAPVQAQAVAVEELTKQTTAWQNRLKQIREEIKNVPLSQTYLTGVQSQIEKIVSEASDFITNNQPAVDNARAVVEKLPEPPKEGEPAEQAKIAEQRQALSKKYNDLQAAVGLGAAIRTEAEQLLDQVAGKRRELFANQVMKRTTSPFSLQLWQEAVPALGRAGKLLATVLNGWRSQHSAVTFWLMFGFVVLLGVGLHAVMRRLIAGYRRYPRGAPPPPFFRQAVSAGIVSVMRAFAALVSAGLLYLGMAYFGMLTVPIDEIAATGLLAIAAFAIIAALSTTLLAPNRPLWRIFPVSSSAANRLNRLMIAIAGIYSLDLFLDFLSKTLVLPLSLTIMQSAIAAVIFAGLLVAVLRTPLQTHQLAHSAGPPPRLVKLLKLPLWLVVFTVLAATALGYISLARLVSHQTVVTGSIIIVAYLIHLSINEFTDSFGETDSTGGRLLNELFAMPQQRREQIGAISMLTLNLLLVLVTLPLLLVQWTFDWSDVWNWSRKILFGFEFGGLRISFSAILIALLLFLLGTALTRFFQQWLDRRILSKSASQTGAENSIKTAVGYAGVVISALLAISYTGISFSNIAIVAGALSVGIGFGLQSIVNNFVSGLILLAERPIKVGDWIVVGDDEGTVRRISVRSTEIETFNRAQIVIPNSELISGTVTNWTLRGSLGRIVINVGVSYDADPQKVHDLLLEIANADEAILEYPASFVVFEDFGASSLDFSLRCFVPDITNSLSIRTRLRMTIFNRFKQEGIEIPFPQRDLNLRDMDRLEKALQGPPAPSGQRSRRRRGKPSQSRSTSDGEET